MSTSETEDLTIPCDSYLRRALEVETGTINRFNARAGLARVDLVEVAKEVIADWAIQLLLERQPNREMGGRRPPSPDRIRVWPAGLKQPAP